MRIRTWAIGLFITVGFALFVIILFLIGDRQKAFNKHVKIYTEFANLNGLSSGAKVRVSGLDAGQVKKVIIPQRPTDKFRLELEVDGNVNGMLRRDSLVSISTEGVVGDKLVEVQKGSERAEPVRSGDTLPSKEPLDMSALMEKGSALLNDVHGSIQDVRGRVDTALDTITKTVNNTDTLVTENRPNIHEIARSGAQIADKLDLLITDVNAGKGPAGLLLRNEQTRQQIQDTLSDVKRASANISDVSQRADQTMTDFQSRQLLARTQATIDHLQSVSQQLDVTLNQALARDEVGQDGAANLRETLSNLNRSTANLADDTEALKHNFFFKGFFKKRGFYDLDRLTRTEYVEACSHQKEAGPRRWIPAAGLLANDADGHETISDSGQHLIDSEMASVVESLPSHIVVVEGYSQTGSPNEQFVASRRRADLVRHYLEYRYHLRHDNLGIVPLRNQPPAGAEKDSWDGVAIMLFAAETRK